MPTIVCPTCATKLEIDDDMVGEDVQCGSCQQIFKAEPDKKKSSRAGGDGEKPRKSKYRKDDDEDDEDDRPSRRRNALDDDEDDDDEDEEERRPRRRAVQGSNGMGIASLVLGILGLLGTVGVLINCCCALVDIPFPILAIVFGVMSLKTPGKGMGIAGIIMGGLNLALLALTLILSFGIIAAMIGGGAGGGGAGGGGGFNNNNPPMQPQPVRPRR